METPRSSQFTKHYARIFAVEEIARSSRLKWAFIVSWALCLIDLLATSEFPLLVGGRSLPVCWAYWSQCAQQYAFDSAPRSYNYTIWIAIIFGFLTASIWFLFYEKWNRAHFFLALVILWKVALNFVFVNYHHTGFEFFHLIPSLVLLFARNKLQSMRYILSLLYLFSIPAKFDESWILGNYFSNGMSVISNAVILLEIVFAVGLLSRNKKMSTISFWTWTFFHIFSVSFIGFKYPLRALGFLWCLFGFSDLKLADVPARKIFLGGTTAVIAFFVMVSSSLPLWISTNPQATFEGTDYGVFMVDSNYQCLHSMTTMNSQGEVLKSWKGDDPSARSSCYPQDVLQDIQRKCGHLNPGEHIAWKFSESRNGGPFYEVIHEEDACALTYKSFTKNAWIHAPEVSSQAAVPWFYRGLKDFYFALWFVAVLFLINYLFFGTLSPFARKISWKGFSHD